MQNLIKILKNTCFYFFGSVLSRIIGLLMLPIYTRYISPSDFGYYDLTVTYITIIGAIVFLDIGTATLRFLFDENSPSWKNKIITNSYLIFACCAAVYITGFWIFCLATDTQYGLPLFLLGLSNAGISFYRFIARGFEKNKVFVFSGILGSAVQAALNIYFLIVLKMDFSSLYWAMIIGNIAQCLLMEYSIRAVRMVNLSLFDLKLIRSMFIFSLPLCLNSISNWLGWGYNRTVIVHYLGNTANGFYATAGRFALVVTMIGSAFALAWQEMSYQKSAENKNKKEFFGRAFALYLKLVLCGYLVLVPFVNAIFPYFVAPQYYPANKLIPLYMLWVILDMITNFLGTIITGSKATKAVFVTTLAGAAANILLVHILVPRVGINGANISLALSFILVGFLRLSILKKIMDFKADAKILAIFAPLILLMSVNIVPQDKNIWLFAAACAFAAVYLRAEIKQTLSYAASRISAKKTV